MKIQREVPDGAWDAFISYQRELTEAAVAAGGVESIHHFRVADPSQALTVNRLQSRHVYEALLDSSDFGKLLLSTPEGVNRIRTECFEVVSDVGPKK